MPRPSKHDGVLYRRKESSVWWMRYRDKRGERQFESTGCADWQEASKKLRERLAARDQNVLEVVRKGEQLLFREWADHFMQNYSQPPMREPKTHAANGRAMKHLLKPATVHQEFRVLRRMLNVAVRKRLLPANPCWGVEFPVRVKGMFRPYYMSWSEQQKIEFQAPGYLANAVRIISETGLRVYKELTPMRKDQVDLVNATVWIPDSKTENGIAEVPLTDVALQAFKDQIQLAGLGRGSFRAARTRPAIRRRSRRRGTQRYDAPAFRIFGFTICVRPTLPGFLLAVSQTSGSPNCFGRVTPKSLRSTRR